MRILKKFKVGAHVYEIMFPYVFTERTDLRGQSDHLECTVKLSCQYEKGKRITRQNTELTLLHEIIHCVDAVYNGSKMEEDTVERMGEGLYQVLEDNGFFRDSEEGDL